MPKLRKKPVIIEAMQFNGLDDYLSIVQWMKDSGDTSAIADEVRYATPIMFLHTLEGTMAANPGDWIIKGVKGEFYPCKPDIFAATYEGAELKGIPDTGRVFDIGPGTLYQYSTREQIYKDALEKVLVELTIPAAEYVPAIRDCWQTIREALCITQDHQAAMVCGDVVQ